MIRARVAGGDWAPVREALDEEAAALIWEHASGPRVADHPDDFVFDSVEVEIDYGPFALHVRRGTTSRMLYRARIGDVVGPEHSDEERALWSVLELVGDAPRACFFCKWSDVEASTGWGNFGCFVEQRAAYERYVAEHAGKASLKWVSSLGCTWVEPFHGCDRFELRPIGFGYRGRPAR